MSALLVRLGEVEVGVLEHFEDESERFTFSPSYVSALSRAKPVLGQIFEDRFPNSIDVGGPICWFAHLLPQGVMRRWRCRLLNLDEDDSFGLLRTLGEDLPGAVRLSPTEPLLHRQSPLPTNVQPVHEGIDNSVLRFSLAGAQWKLSARSEGPGLTTRAMTGGVPCIAKFHSPDYPGLPQCEFATMNWAKASEIRVPKFEMRRADEFDRIPEAMPVGDGSVFVIDRFDRVPKPGTPDQRIHMEDFGQILDRPPGDDQYRGSYEEIAAVLRWIAPDSASEFLKLVAFNVLCGNGDAHLKNFSVLYKAPGGRTAGLSPAYDLVSTIQYYEPGKEKLALRLNRENSFSSIRFGNAAANSSFTQLTRELGFSDEDGHSAVVDAANCILNAWNDSSVRESFSERQINRIENHLKLFRL